MLKSSIIICCRHGSKVQLLCGNQQVFVIFSSSAWKKSIWTHWEGKLSQVQHLPRFLLESWMLISKTKTYWCSWMMRWDGALTFPKGSVWRRSQWLYLQRGFKFACKSSSKFQSKRRAHHAVRGNLACPASDAVGSLYDQQKAYMM
jgi:hypothetical protein